MSTSDISDQKSITSDASDAVALKPTHGIFCINFEGLKLSSSLAKPVKTWRKIRRTQCKICNKILEAFKTDGPRRVILSSVDDFLSATCTIHPNLVSSYPEVKDIEDDTDYVVAFRSGPGVTLIGYDSVTERRMTSRQLLLVSRTPSPQFSCIGRIISPEAIDTKTFRKWIRRCDREHGGKCRSSPAATGLPPPTLSWLIDTSQKCLVPALPEMSYIALSYVWGEVPMLKTLREDLERLQEPGALSLQNQQPPIPRTILDAMTVVRLIGEKYLWVDSLCIIQDDEEARHIQIRGMASIYANASLTIIAEQGENADFGLIGIPGDKCKPRLPLPERVEIKKGWEVVKTIRDRNKTLSAWHHRGWTFQEHLFSQKRLIFGHNRVRWECYRATWYDDIEELTKTQQPSWYHRHQLVQTQGMFSLHYPHLGEYNSLVRHYNGRALSYPEDALAAFSGITTALSRSFAGGFICGMPVLFFDVALLWHGTKTLERRVSRKISSVGDSIPSWSWAGWRGEIYIWSWFQGMDYLKYGVPPLTHSRRQRRVVPVLQWYSKESVSSASKLIQPSWSMYRSHFITGNEETPPGWTRHEYRPGHGQICAPEGYPEPGVIPSFFYKHESDSSAEFWYPIPLVQGGEDLVLNPVAPLLSCRTLRATLHLGGTSNIAGEPYVVVRDQEDRWAGMLFLPQSLWNITGVDRVKTNSCELIMLSRGYSPVDNHTDERYSLEFMGRYGPSDVYEYYNVLWIEWQGEIAYRKAVGRIERKTWEREATEWIDLTLG